MNAHTNPGAAKGLREWWATPPRSGLQRLINPWEYRHARPFGIVRLVGGSVAVIASLICLAYAAYGWAAFFLALGTLNLGGGYWYITIARSAQARGHQPTEIR